MLLQDFKNELIPVINDVFASVIKLAKGHQIYFIDDEVDSVKIQIVYTAQCTDLSLFVQRNELIDKFIDAVQEVLDEDIESYTLTRKINFENSDGILTLQFYF